MIRAVHGYTRAAKKSPAQGGALWLAGGLGFEPRLTESESAVLPLDDTPRIAAAHAGGDSPRPCGIRSRPVRASALRVLRTAAGLAAADLLALDLARIARHEAGDAHRNVELAGELSDLEGLAHDHAARFAAEELIERAAIDRDSARAGPQIDPRRRGLAATGAIVLLERHPRFLVSGAGC